MAAYGYAQRVVDDEFQLLELKEISLDVSLNDLRRIADFLQDCANQAESGTWQTSHLHMKGALRTLGFDLIINNPSSASPPRIQGPTPRS